MATFYTVPKGPLISFAGFTFQPNRSLLLPNWSLATSADVSQPVGSTAEVDLAGYSDLAMHGTYTWEYLVRCGPGRTTKAMQDELTTLLTMLRTRNADGSTGQVGTLVVGLVGYTGTSAVATARLVNITSGENGPLYEKLHLEFLCPSGFSYTA